LHNRLRNLLATLLLARGTPLILGGDDIQQVLVVQPGSELGRPDQVANSTVSLRRSALSVADGRRHRQRGGRTAGVA
jgi:hypothetical protein